jgi:hypothetical protein
MPNNIDCQINYLIDWFLPIQQGKFLNKKTGSIRAKIKVCLIFKFLFLEKSHFRFFLWK